MDDNRLEPEHNETPSSYADRLGLYYTSKVTIGHKKSLGQFFTPVSVARFMANLCSLNRSRLKILDPGCGIGILACAVVEALIANGGVVELELVAFETDVEILPLTDRCLEYLRDWLIKKDVQFSYFLCKNDFVLHNSTLLATWISSDELYDVIIANPPYFKMPKSDPRALAAKSVSFGQSNIYSIFLIIAGMLLQDHGELIFITPRSFTSGSYFRMFREKIFSMVDLVHIHLFESRKDAFQRDKILQENIIVLARKKREKNKCQLQLDLSELSPTIKISTSKGISDVLNRTEREFPFESLVNFESSQKILHLPLSRNDVTAIAVFKSWRNTLKDYEMEISTGPVVDFRSSEFILDEKKEGVVPLIYLHNVGKMSFNWPAFNKIRGKSKGRFIVRNEKSEGRLVANKDYVLLRRFSSKDDESRLVSTAYFSKLLCEFEVIGIENHLNYIYRPKGVMLPEEVMGLAVLLNSKLFDIYFRTFNGNINVSATELRVMPLPNLETIKKIGRLILIQEKIEQECIDKIVEDEFKIDLI